MTLTPAEPFQWEYAESKEAASIVSIQDRYGLFIDGDFTEPRSKQWMPTLNPATEDPIAQVAVAGD